MAVLLKKSSVPGKVPLTADLSPGELAINYADGKLYFKNAADQVVAVASSAATTGQFSALSYTGTLTGGTDTINIGTGQLYKDATGKFGFGTTVPGATVDVKGSLRLSGATSGYVGFMPAANAGNITYNLPVADGTVAGQVLTTNANATLSWTSVGTVTSVSGSGTVNGLTLTGTVTQAGGLTLGGTLLISGSDFAIQTAKTFLAAPNGSNGTPSFRVLVASDIPTLNQSTTGTASNVTGTVAVANGGTGATTASAAFNALSPTTTLGDLIYGSATNTATRLAGNTTSTKQFLRQTGTGTVSAAPAWDTLVNADIPAALTGKTYNALSLTAAATGFTVAGGTTSKTLTVSNTITLSGTDSSTLNIGTGGTLGTAAYTASTAYAPSAGSTSVTTLGTITSGTWNATAIAIGYGGTGQNNKTSGYNALTPITTLGDLPYHDGTNAVRLAGNTVAAKRFLTQTGTGTVSAAPGWAAIVDADIPNLTGKTYNGLTVTLSTGTLTVANAKTLSANNTLTFSGTDGSTLNIGAGGTLGTAAYTASTAYQPVDADLTAIAALVGTSGLLKKTAADTWTLDTTAYISANQNISVSGDATGSGTTAITLTLANSGVSAGTYTKITVDSKGRATVGGSIASTDVTTALGYTPVNPSVIGAASGITPLGADSRISSTYLPSYVDDVLEYANQAGFPATGETGKIYVALDVNKIFRWSGTVYVEISASPGSTDVVTEGVTNLYFTTARARSSISATQNITYSTATGVITGPDLSGYLTSATAATTYLTAANPSYTGTLTGGTGVVNLGSGQFVKDAAGNLGLGVVPVAGYGNSLQMQQPGGGGTSAFLVQAINTNDQRLYLSNNALPPAGAFSGNFKYTVSGAAATNYLTTAGQHQWFTAPVGTAGNVITFTQAMTLDASGNLGIGTSSPSARLDVAGSFKNNAEIRSSHNSANYVSFVSAGSSGNMQAGVNGADAVVFSSSGALKLQYDGLGVATGGDTLVGGNLLPGADNTQTLGSAAKRWSSVRAGSFNALSLTANAIGFALAGGTTSKTLTVSNTLTLSGTDGSTLNIGAGGTLGTAAYTASTAYAPATSGTAILYGNGSGGFSSVTVGSGLLFTGGTLSSTAGGGSVTSVSVVSANGFAGTVATATSTPAITLTTSITGLLKGNGTAISAASAGTDYSAGTSALATGILKSTTTTGALTIALAADFPTLNQNTTGTAANVTGTVAVGNGGTGASTKAAGYNALTPITTLGDVVYGDGANSATRLAGNTTSTKKFLRQTGTGTVSAAPAWDTLVDGDIPNLTGKTYNALSLTAATIGFTVAGGTTSKTLTISNTLTFSGTDGATLNIGAGGILGTAAYTASTVYQPVDADLTAIAALAGTSGLLRKTAADTWTLDTTAFGTGSVTSVSVVSANGFAGTVATATSTPAITISTSITGLLKGNGTAISAASAGTDYSAGTSALATGILKSTTTTGALTIAVAADFPTLNQNTTGTAANVTGTVAVGNGGTGATTAAAALTALGAYAASNPAGYTTNTGTVTSVAAGSYLTGGTITSTGTIAVDATVSNTASKIVARDASGNFQAGIITTTGRQENYGVNTNAGTQAGVMGGTSAGTIAVPTQTPTSTNLYSISSIGYTGSAWVGTSGIDFVSSEAITATNRGSNVVIRAIAAGQATATTLVWNGTTLNANGTVLTGNTGTVTGVTATAPVASTGGTAPVISMAAASSGVNGYMTGVYATKLDGIAAGAQVNVATNLAQGTRTTTTVPVTSSTGTSATLDIATTLLAGVMSSADKTKLDGIATGATANTGTVTSVAALTIGTTGTDVTSTVATGTTTPVITLNIPTASATNRGALSAADWTTFNNKQPAGSYLTAESDTLATVTGRGNVATNNLIVPAVEGNGFGFWGANDTYGLSMGVTAATYQYGPVTDYSIKTYMSNSAGRGFTWGVKGNKPIAGLEVTTGNMTIAGTFSALSKSFLIDHPTKPGMKLRYGSLEGPENGVYVRGRLKGNKIELPEYWTKLVDPASITVNLTPIGKSQDIYVEDIVDNIIYVGGENVNCFYTVFAERVDIDKLEVEV